MKKENQTSDILDVLKSVIKPITSFQINTEVKQTPETDIRPDHQPSWMYRNE